MRLFPFLCLSLCLVALALPLRSQSVNTNRPPEIPKQQPSPQDVLTSRMNNLRLQQDAKDLGDLCNSIPPDMDGLKRGILAKDLLDRLKRVEKLSKRLREELTQ